MTGDRPEPDFAYEISREELRHGLALTDLERLQRLDELRRFTIMLREAPTVRRPAAEPDPGPYSADRSG